MWGTPVARDDQKTPEARRAMLERLGGGRTEITSLTVQVKDWPTPKASEGHRGTDPARPGRTGGPSLIQAVRDWPTPTAHDAKGQGHDNTNLHNAAMHGRQAGTTPTDGPTTSPPADLNPRFVEALMGVPPGWLTPCTSVATDSFQWWLRAHSLNSPTDSASTSGKA